MMKLFMVLIGCKPPGRRTEQHDVFFGIGQSMNDLIPDILSSWPETGGKMHFDAWREVTEVDGYAVQVLERTVDPLPPGDARLFFINLGGYKQGEFEEFHYKMLAASPTKSIAIDQAKHTAFFRHTGFADAHSHIDDKYGIDVDDIYEIEDILPAAHRKQFRVVVAKSPVPIPADEIHLGYFKLNSFGK